MKVSTHLLHEVHAGFLADVCTKVAVWNFDDEDASAHAVIVDIATCGFLYDSVDQKSHPHAEVSNLSSKYGPLTWV